MSKPYITDEGYRVYRNTCLLTLVKAIGALDRDAEYDVHQSVNRSTYVEFKNKVLTTEDINTLKSLMKKYIKDNVAFDIKSVPKEDAAKLLAKSRPNTHAEKAVFTPRETIDIYSDENCCISVYGKTASSAGYLSEFDIMPYENGLLLRYPHPNYNGEFPPNILGKKIIKTIEEYRDWNDVIGISNVFELISALTVISASASSSDTNLISPEVYDALRFPVPEDISAEFQISVILFEEMISFCSVFPLNAVWTDPSLSNVIMPFPDVCTPV